MASIRNPIGELVTLATADDLDGTIDNTQVLDLTGAAGAIIAQVDNGTAGTAGVDAIEFSTDGGSSYLPATAANLAASNKGHAGLMAEDGSKAAQAGALLNAAGVEPATGAVFFSLQAVDGPFQIRCGRKTTDTGGTTWVTGAPSVYAFRLG